MQVCLCLSAMLVSHQRVKKKPYFRCAHTNRMRSEKGEEIGCQTAALNPSNKCKQKGPCEVNTKQSQEASVM